MRKKRFTSFGLRWWLISLLYCAAFHFASSNGVWNEFSCTFKENLCAWQTEAQTYYAVCGNENQLNGPLCPDGKAEHVQLKSSSQPGEINLEAEIPENSQLHSSSLTSFCLQVRLFLVSTQPIVRFQVYVLETGKDQIERLAYTRSNFNREDWTTLFVPLSKRTRKIRFHTNQEQLYIHFIHTQTGQCIQADECNFEEIESCIWLSRHRDPVSMKMLAANAPAGLPKMDATLGNDQGHFFTIEWDKLAQLPSNSAWKSIPAPVNRKDVINQNDQRYTMRMAQQILPGGFTVDFWIFRQQTNADEVQLSMFETNELVETLWTSEKADEIVNQQWSHVIVNGECKSRGHLELSWIRRKIITSPPNTSSNLNLNDEKIEKTELVSSDPIESGLVAIDDIRFRRYHEKYLHECKFQNSFCSHITSSEQHEKALWMLGTGRLLNPKRVKWYKPPSTQGDNKFAYVDLTNQKIDEDKVKVQLLTGFYPATPRGQLTLGYNLQLDDLMSSELVIEIVLTNGRVYPLLNIAKSTLKDWEFRSVCLHSSHPFRFRTRLYLPSVQESVPFVAINLFKYDPNDCEIDQLPNIVGGDETTLTPMTRQAHLLAEVSCNFVENVCNWLNADESWKSTTVTNPPVGLPPMDPRGISLSKSGYMFLSSDTNAIITSSLMSPMSALETQLLNIYCFRLAYFVAIGSVEVEFNVKLVQGNQVQLLLAVGEGQNLHFWRHKHETLYVSGQFQIRLEVQLKSAAIAIYGMSVARGACEMPLSAIDFDCDFEENGVCGIHTPNVRDGFKRMQASDLAGGLMLMRDHTLNQLHGHVIGINLKKQGQPQEISSEMQEFAFPVMAGQQLLRFWGSFYCKKCTIKVILRQRLTVTSAISEKEIWKYSTFQPVLDWFPYEITYTVPTSNRNWWIVFQLEYNRQDNNFFAIDDISLKHGLIANDVCDVGSRCMWFNHEQQKKHFLYLESASLTVDSAELEPWKSSWSSISYQHNHIQIPADEDNNAFLFHAGSAKAAVFQSPPLQIKTDNVHGLCLRLQAFRAEGSQSKFLQILISSASTPKSRWQTSLITEEMLPAGKWTKLTINLTTAFVEPLFPNQMVIIYLHLQQLYIGEMHGFAMNRLQLRPHFCSSSLELTNNKNGVNCLNAEGEEIFVTKEKMCDFVVDCSDGEDELDCGDCKFNQGQCGYVNSPENHSPSMDWQHGCPIGHRFGLVCPFMYVKKTTISDLDAIELSTRTTSNLLSGVMRNSHPTCTLRFQLGNVFGYELKIFAQLASGMELILGQERGNPVERVERVQTHEVPVGAIDGEFRLKFSINMVTLITGVGIQEISLLNCGRPRPKHSPSGLISTCTKDEFRCSNGACLPLETRCNLINDCGDRSDEHFCQYSPGSCDFEQGTCEWKIEGQMRWVTGQPSINLGPVRDHTLNLPNGHYLLLSRNAIESQPHHVSIIVNKLSGLHLRINGSSCGLRMYFMCNRCKIVLQLISLSGKLDYKYQFQANSLINWSVLDVDLFRSHQGASTLNGLYLVNIELHHLIDSEFIAVDDIYISGECGQNLVDRLDCSFGESGDETCDWIIHSHTEYIRTILQSVNIPKEDEEDNDMESWIKQEILHQQGQQRQPDQAQSVTLRNAFLQPISPPPDSNGWTLFEFIGSNLFQVGEYSLLSRPLSYEGLTWASFRYSLAGIDVGQVSMSITAPVETLSSSTTSTLFRSHGELSIGQWQKACIPFHALPDERIELKAVMQSDSSYLAIADFSLSDRPCEEMNERPYCHFDDLRLERCSYIELAIGWKVGEAISVSLTEDHTLRTPAGSMLISLKPSERLQSKLKLKWPNDHAEACVSFWYTSFVSGSGVSEICGGTSCDGNRRGTRLLLRDSVNKHEDPMFESRLDEEGQWQWARVSVTQKTLLELVVLQDEDLLRFAIDDLQISARSCSDTIDCNFDVNTCGWLLIEQPTVKLGWMHTTPKRLAIMKTTTVPKNDVSQYQNTGGMLFTFINENQFGKQAVLRSARYRPNKNGNCFQFYYWIAMSSKLELQVQVANAKSFVKVFHETGNTNFAWKMVKITLPRLVEDETQQIRIVANIRRLADLHRKLFDDSIALDNFKLGMGPCAARRGDDLISSQFTTLSTATWSEEGSQTPKINEENKEKEKEMNSNENDNQIENEAEQKVGQGNPVKSYWPFSKELTIAGSLLIIIIACSMIGLGIALKWPRKKNKLRKQMTKAFKKACNKSESFVYVVQPSNIYETIELK